MPDQLLRDNMNLVAEHTTALAGNAQLEALRKKGQESFSGLPAAKAEEYKFTNLAKALEKAFPNGFGQASTPQQTPDISRFTFSMEAYRVVLLDGYYQAELSNLPETGLSLLTLAEAVKEGLTLEADAEKDPFIALNQANLEQGLVIRISKNTKLDKPLVIHHLLSAETNAAAVMPRIIVEADRFAEFKLVEVHNTLGDAASFSNLLTEVKLEEGAKGSHYIVQTANDEAIQVNTTEVFQKANSTYTSTTITLGGQMVRNNLNIALNAENTEANMYGLYMLHGKQHVDNHTTVDHRQPHCLSNELYKGIMDEKSTGVFNGKIFVRQPAQKTNAFQSNKNILLTDQATMHTKPQLEIWADDVKCSHGATTGQIDDEQVFYLRSRGISETDARRMLLHAFAADIFEHIEIEELKEHFLTILAEKFATT